MPISVDAELVQLSQEECAQVAYGVMSQIFSLHNELGRLFDEQVYGNALVKLLDDVRSEVRIDVSFRDFQKFYYMDLLASSGVVFELKSVDTLHVRHSSQLLNYLLLTGLQHGKLVNFKSWQVEHRFVNATQTHAERVCFEVDDSNWHETDGLGISEKHLFIDLLRDWGTGLERALYEEAAIHFFGGPNQGLSSIDVCVNGDVVAQQAVVVCAPRVALKVSTLDKNMAKYRDELIRFLRCTNLSAIQWLNISRGQLVFETVQ